MIVTEITTHVADALNRLLQQYRGLPNMTALITALVDQVQDFENAAYPVDAGRQLFNGTTYPAVGAQLDGIGQLVNVARNGLTDAEYLILILGTISENFSDGTWTSILNIISILTQSTDITVFEHFPASIAIMLEGPNLDPAFWPLVGEIVEASLGATISLAYISTYDPTNVFCCSGGKVAGQGFAPYSTNPQTSGGAFVRMLYESSGE